MTVRDMLFDKIDARLVAATIADEVAFMPSGDPDGLTALQIFDQGETRIESEAGTDRMRLVFTVEGYVAGEGGKAVHRALNALRAGAVLALFDGSPEGEVLDSLAEEIELGDFSLDIAVLAERRSMAFVQEFFLTYATRRGDPATPA
jgi:hypothetical protein